MSDENKGGFQVLSPEFVHEMRKAFPKAKLSFNVKGGMYAIKQNGEVSQYGYNDPSCDHLSWEENAFEVMRCRENIKKGFAYEDKRKTLLYRVRKYFWIKKDKKGKFQTLYENSITHKPDSDPMSKNLNSDIKQSGVLNF